MTHPETFTGTWQLQRWEALRNGAPVGFPMEEDAQGQIIYAPDGYMCAFLMRADFAGSGQPALPDTCLSYGGAWQFDGTEIHHTVSFSSLAHWVGRTLSRHVSRDGDLMILKTVPEFSKSGTRHEHVLVWKKVAV